MTTALRRQARGTADGTEGQEPADALVVFGITGDLAKVMTFTSLYRLERRGLLDCPIIGVAVDDWTADQLRNHARIAITATGEELDEKVFERFANRLSYVAGDFADPATYERVSAALGGARTPVFYLEIPPFLFGRGGKGLGGAGLPAHAPAVPVRARGEGARRRGPHGERPRRRREAVRPRRRVRARAGRRAARVHRRVAAVPDRPLPREDGARRDPLPALRQRDPRAGLEPEPRRGGAAHDGRELRRRGPRALLRPGRRPARRRRQPHDAGRRRDRHGGAGRP